MSFTRTRFCQIAALALVISALSQAALADKAPRPSVRMLVPCPIGSPTDISAREIARWWSEHSASQYQVENVPIRTASIHVGVAFQPLSDANVMLFDLGDCNNSADVE